MGNVGSYVLSLQDRTDGHDVDLQTASTQVLKFLGREKRAQSMGALLAGTGLSEFQLHAAIESLAKDGLVSSENENFSLTDLGYKAHLIVAT
jgi:predicted transcriptional regulator